MAQWLSAKVEKRIDWNDHLFSLQMHCRHFPAYVAGQFTKFGLKQDDKVISRPYSLVSHPGEPLLEIIAVPVEDGLLSPQLHQLQEGDSVEVMAPATGFLTLAEVPDSATLWLLATGTGVGPFISILRGQEVWQRYANIVLVYAARYAQDLAYGADIQIWQARYPEQFKFVSVVSREKSADGLHGRIPELLQSEQIQIFTGKGISAEDSQVMLCGNPDMITSSIDVLQGFGLSKHLRRSPGQISMERYW